MPERIVYVIGIDGDSQYPLKIGETFGDPFGRLVDIQVGNPAQLCVLESWNCEASDTAIHAVIAHHRVRGEWFTQDEQVHSLIDTLTECVETQRVIAKIHNLQRIDALCEKLKIAREELPSLIVNDIGRVAKAVDSKALLFTKRKLSYRQEKAKRRGDAMARQRERDRLNKQWEMRLSAMKRW